MKKNLAAIFALGLFLLASSCGQGGSPSPTTRQWTIMLYCAGDNDLESLIFDNVNQLEKVGSTSQVAMVAQTDWWHHEGTSETLSTGEGVGRWYLEKDPDMSRIKSPLIVSLEEINTGTAEAIRDFVVWAAANYPASRYLLIISSHGGGWRSPQPSAKGVGQDYTSDPEKGLLITLPELKRVLPDIYSALGSKKIDLLAIDACLNGATEFAYQVKDYADILIASEEIIPGTGYPYDNFAADLVANPTMSAEALAINIVNYYQAQYHLQSNTTLAAIQLNKIGGLAERLKNFAALFDAAKAALFRELVNYRSGNQYTVQRYHDVTFRDLWDMADKVCQNLTGDAYAAITAESAAIKAAVEEAVIISRYTTSEGGRYSVANSYGLSIYLPTPQTTTYESEYSGLDFSADTGWGSFLQLFN